MINLESPPTTTPHLMADFIELCLATSEYDVIAISDILSLLNEDESREYLSDKNGGGSNEETSAEINEKTLRIANERFEHLKFRKEAFGDFYPFYFENKALRIYDNLTDKHCLYLFLLICSRLKALDRSIWNKLTKLFEVISARALKQMIPNAIVKIFGKDSEDRKSYYGEKLKDAINILIKDLNEGPHEAAINEIDSNNTGDGGLDIVAYFPWEKNDPGRGTITFFGQCSASESNWEDKDYEVRKPYGYIHFCHEPIRLLFIPVCFRNTSGHWVKYIPTHECILLDRLRICNLLKNNIPSQDLQEPSLTKLFTHYGLN